MDPIKRIKQAQGAYFNVQKNRQVADNDNDESDSDEPRPGYVIEKNDMMIWPIEIVQENFQRFLVDTDNLNYKQPNIMTEFCLDSDPPKNEDLQHIFDISLNRVQGRQNKKKWKDNEKELLQWIILRYSLQISNIPGDFGCEDWRSIAKLMIGRNASQCKYKWLSKSKYKLVQVPWTRAEDDSLISIYNDYRRQGKQNKWSDMAKEIALRCRTQVVRQGKQCRERWINKLDPQISKGPWSKIEEVKILKLILLKGKKWSEISKLLQNSRTENSLKNRYHTLMKKERSKLNFSAVEVDVSELIDKLKQTNKLVNPVHLYEDIDSQELFIILKLIEKLEQVTGVLDLQLDDDEFHNEREESEEKVVYKPPNVIKVSCEQAKQPEKRASEEVEEQFSITDQQKMVNIIKKIVSKTQQKQEIDYRALDTHFDQVVQQVGGQNIDLEVVNMNQVDDKDLEDYQLTLVDPETSTVYTFPNEYFEAVMEKLNRSQLDIQKPQQIQQIVPQQYIMPAQPMPCTIAYPQTYIYPQMQTGMPFQFSQFQGQMPGMMMVSNQYFPMYNQNMRDTIQPIEVKSENTQGPQQQLNFQQVPNFLVQPYQLNQVLYDEQNVNMQRNQNSNQNQHSPLELLTTLQGRKE